MANSDIRTAIDEIRAEAQKQRVRYELESIASALEWAADRFAEACCSGEDEAVTLKEAARRSGYEADHLGRLIRQGRIPNAGRKGAPRIYVGDIPLKPGRSAARNSTTAYDPVTDARSLLSRRGGSAPWHSK